MKEKERKATEVLTAAVIMEMAAAFQRSRVLLTAYELDVFTVLAQGNTLSTEVAGAVGAAHRSTDRLLNALHVLGLLEKHEGRFSNTPAASHFLVRTSPDYMANLMHVVNLWETWSTLTEAVRRGTTVVGGHVEEREDAWQKAFIAAMHYFGKDRAAEVVAQLDLSGVSRVLDVGGGSGAFAMAFVRAKEGLAATVFDLPSVIPLTREYVEGEGLSDRIDFVPGDFNFDSLGSGYDTVFVSSIIHSNSFEENRALIRKAADALDPGGQLVIRDFIVDEDRTGPPMAVLFALNMLVGTEAGDTYTESEVRAWMTEAGLGEIARKETSFATLIIGRKAA